jgi:predicted amidohydrolase
MRAAAIQLNSDADRDRNLASAEALVRAAAADGATFVALPERFDLRGDEHDYARAAEPLESSGTVAWARALAAELRVDLVAGSISERREHRDKLSNTSVHVGPDGELKGTYRKIHLFDVTVGDVDYRESDSDEPGDTLVVSEAADGTPVGLSICYDVRFPELYQALAERGAQVIAVPAAFTLPTTRDHWELLLRARAIETQSFVIGANQIGSHPGGFRSGGRSMIVDPWGLVLASAPDSETAIVADLDFALLRDVRRRLPSLTHRRPEAYESGRVEVHP